MKAAGVTTCLFPPQLDSEQRAAHTSRSKRNAHRYEQTNTFSCFDSMLEKCNNWCANPVLNYNIYSVCAPTPLSLSLIVWSINSPSSIIICVPQLDSRKTQSERFVTLTTRNINKTSRAAQTRNRRFISSHWTVELDSHAPTVFSLMKPRMKNMEWSNFPRLENEMLIGICYL